MPKRTQEGHEAKAASPRRPWKDADFSAILEDSEGKNQMKTVKKQHKQSSNFWSRLLSKNVWKLMPKASQNRCQNPPKSIPEGSRDENQKKYKKWQHYSVLAWFLECRGFENPTKINKKRYRKRYKNQVRLWSWFFKDFLWNFWEHLGPQDRPKVEEKLHQNTKRF